MATYANSSHVVKNIGTSASTILTVLSGTEAVSSLIVSNTITSPITTSVYVTRSTVDYYIVKDATIPVGGSLEVIQGNRIVLMSGDTLKVVNSAASSGDCVASVLSAT
jgi:hypothetical protein